MKRLVLPTTMLVLLFAATARSGEEQKSGNADNPAAKPAPIHFSSTGVATAAPGPSKSAADWYIESYDRMVKLTDSQKKAIKDIYSAREKAWSDFQAKNAEKMSAASRSMAEAFKSKDQEAIAKAQKEYQELLAPLHEAMKEANGKLQKILTPEQKKEQQAKQQEWYLAAMVRSMTAGVQVSDEQMKAARDIVAAREKTLNDFRTKNAEKLSAASRAIMDAYKSKDPAAIAKTRKNYQDLSAPVREAMEQSNAAFQRLLTPEQKDALKKSGAFWVQPSGKPTASSPNTNLSTGKSRPAEKNVTVARLSQAGTGIFTFATSAELNPALKPKQSPTIARSNGKAEAARYWLGLSVGPVQGLAVGLVMPDSPAAKAGLKPHDILVKAGDKPLKTVAEIVEAVQKAQGADLPLEVLRDGTPQTITVKPAKRPAEVQAYKLGVSTQPTEAGKPAQPGAKITRLAGGGTQVFVPGAAAKDREGVAREALQKTLLSLLSQKALAEAPKQKALTEAQDQAQLQKAKAEAHRAHQRRAIELRIKYLNDKAEQLTKEGKTEEAVRAKNEVQGLQGILMRLTQRRALWEAKPPMTAHDIRNAMAYHINMWNEKAEQLTKEGKTEAAKRARSIAEKIRNSLSQQQAVSQPTAPTAARNMRECIENHIKALNENAERLTKEGKTEEVKQIILAIDKLHAVLARLPQQQARGQVQTSTAPLNARNALEQRIKALNEKAERLSEEAKQARVDAASLYPALARLRLQEAARQVSTATVVVREGREFQELRGQVQELRRQVEELKKMVMKLSQPEKK